MDLYRMPEMSIKDITSYAVEECIRISESELGFFGFINEDETVMTAHLWSEKAMKHCAIDKMPIEFPCGEAGIWAEAIRRHTPIIVNDYKKHDPRKKGLPKGHVPITRLMSIPIVEANKAVAVAAVANKRQDYDDSNLLSLNLFLESVWSIIKRKHAEESLRKAYAEMEDRVTKRTRELEKAKYKVEQEYTEKIRTSEALKQSERLLWKILENLPVGVWIIDQHGKIISGNRAGHEIWSGARYVDIEQYSEYKGWWVDTGALVKPHEWGAARAITKGETSLNEEIEIECFDGSHKFILNSTVPLTNEKGSITGAIVVNQDITKLKQAQRETHEAAHESETLYHQFFQNSVAGTFRTIYNPSTKKARRLDCNEAHARMLGYDRREDLIDLDIKDIFHSDHEFKNYIHELIEKRMLRNYRLSLKQRDGKRIWVLLNASARTYKDNLIIIEGTMVDISEQVDAENKLKDINEQLGLLTTKLIMTEERERRKISIDIHDNVGQTLALTKIKLESLKQLDSKHEFTIILNQIEDLVTQAIQQTRSLMTEVSPSILYELGFTQAIEWLSEKMEADYGLQIILNDDLKKRDIDEEVKVLLFRAVRELLLNVVKHAKASNAYITLQTIGKNIQITIKDKGIGFDISDVDETTKETHRFGLISIKERIKHIGGLVEIRSGKGYGTYVTLVAPRKSPKKWRQKK